MSKIIPVLFLLISITSYLTLAPAWAQSGDGSVTISTKDHPKANGLVFSVTFPAGFEVTDNTENPTELLVAYTNETEFPTVMAVSLVQVPENSYLPFDHKDAKEEDIAQWVNNCFKSASPNPPKILDQEKTSHQGHKALKTAALVDQTLNGKTQPSIEEFLFISYKNHNLTAVCSTFNAQQNPNILEHFYGRQGFAPCNEFFNS
ncbi:MAG: hypothetical protein LBU69_03980, partial [Deltaproteobacteria bacterium]|nr:hypothetical protein [Deltaproteobacteria bacterium]